MGEQDDVAALCASIAAAVAGRGDLDAAAADVQRLPPDLPARGRLAAELLEAVTWSPSMVDPRRLRVIDGLLEIAEAPRPPTPRWTRTHRAARVMSVMRAMAERELTDYDEATERLDALAREAADDPALKPLMDNAYLSLRMARSIHEGDAGAMERLPEELRAMLGALPQDDPRLQGLSAWMTIATDLIATNSRGGDVGPGLRELQRVAEQLPAGDLRDVSDSFVAMIYGSLPGGGAATADQLDALRALTDQACMATPESALHHTAVAAAALQVGEETDLGRVDEGVAALRRALNVAGPRDPLRVFHLSGLALSLMRRAELTNATADLREARDLVEEARALAAGPADQHWQMLNEMLAGIQRMLGETDFHRPALEGLRRHVWQVLVQPDLRGATAAVRNASTDAVRTAVTCLIADDPAAAIAALDSGRGLALFAATEVRGIAVRLDEAGDLDLARRWRAAAATADAQQVPPDLRRDVMKALAAHSSVAGLLDPPGLGEIQQALVTIDADALVYLVPGSGSSPGYAVAAPATGPPSYLALPNLVIEDDRDIEHCLTALSARDVDAYDAGGVDPGDGLEALCRWAWRAAMGPLIESYLPRLPRPASDRPQRVVLVPMGDLARIPWQAAQREDGRHAVELIAISQAASARMLCRSAALAPVPPSPVGLLVGDPDTTDPATGRRRARDLEAARLEAFAVRRSFYRGARYVGRRPDGSVSSSGAGTREEVRKWITASDLGAGTMLHLACHGFVQSGTDHPTAYLLLDSGARLTAEELIALMARAPDRAIGLVVLAACRTGLSINGYDEAYSLGTAFLAGGARSVLSTQWSIPDSDTSALMFMFHHYLRTQNLPVWAALRQAQLWMLDRDREVPQTMPPPMRQQLGQDLHAVIGWAAFVHWGQ